MAYELAKRTADAEQKLATRDGLPARDGALLSARLQRRYQDRITGSFAIPGREGRYVASQGREVGRDGSVQVEVDAQGAVWIGGQVQPVIDGQISWM